MLRARQHPMAVLKHESFESSMDTVSLCLQTLYWIRISQSLGTDDPRVWDLFQWSLSPPICVLVLSEVSLAWTSGWRTKIRRHLQKSREPIIRKIWQSTSSLVVRMGFEAMHHKYHAHRKTRENTKKMIWKHCWRSQLLYDDVNEGDSVYAFCRSSIDEVN